MKVNEDPELARLRARVHRLEQDLSLAVRTIERGPEITMGERERVLAQLKAAA